MATPIAHKGATAGAKVQAMTVLDLVLKPALVDQAWDYFKNVQTKTINYEPLIRAEDKPAIEMNKAVMDKYRPELGSSITIRRATRPTWSSSGSRTRRSSPDYGGRRLTTSG